MDKLFKVFYPIIFAMVVLVGCTPTYPKERLRESIVKVCRDEYKLDVKVTTIGKTIAIYVPLDNLIDFTFAVTKSASEKINDVILSVSRVALSTDAAYGFYCIIAHDIRIPEIQIIIIKSVDDVKRFLLNDISRSEYSKRMLVDIRFSPQAQKERAIKEVFDKMNLDRRWQEDVLNDFFRSEPTALGDIGYWNGRFYIKDISLAEFMAEQIANRIRLAFREEKDLSDIFLVKAIKGAYTARGKDRFFRIEASLEQKMLKESERARTEKKVFEIAVAESAKVTHNYRFENFSYIEIIDQANNRILDVSKEDLESFRKKKLPMADILKALNGAAIIK
jgi:hypothetical protein